MDRDAHDEDGQPLVVGTYRLTREKDADAGRRLLYRQRI